MIAVRYVTVEAWAWVCPRPVENALPDVIAQLYVTHWQPLPTLPKPVKPDSTSGWISVEDQLPLIEKRVFVKTVSGTITFGMLRTRKNNEAYKWQYLCCADDPDVNEWHSSVTNARNGCITHWQPLPDAPADLEEDS